MSKVTLIPEKDLHCKKHNDDYTMTCKECRAMQLIIKHQIQRIIQNETEKKPLSN